MKNIFLKVTILVTVLFLVSVGISNAQKVLNIDTASLPGGAVEDSYFAEIEASGGKGSYSWKITSGFLPSGLSLAEAQCSVAPCQAPATIIGQPTEAGTYTFTVRVIDTENNNTAEKEFTIVIEEVKSSTSNVVQFGQTSEAVKNLQIFLNTYSPTQVAYEGFGAPGEETDYFGPLTENALGDFQKKNGIGPDTPGFGKVVGPLTRDVMKKNYGVEDFSNFRAAANKKNPTIASISPDSAEIDGPGFKMIITGKNFQQFAVNNQNQVIKLGSLVRIGGTIKIQPKIQNNLQSGTVTFISETELAVQIFSTDISSKDGARPGKYYVTVINDNPAGVSNSKIFTITKKGSPPKPGASKPPPIPKPGDENSGVIRIEKFTDPKNTTQTFNFFIDGVSKGPVTVDVKNGYGYKDMEGDIGDYTVYEEIPAGWVLSLPGCSSKGWKKIENGYKNVIVSNKGVSCIFKDTKGFPTGNIKIHKVANEYTAEPFVFSITGLINDPLSPEGPIMGGYRVEVKLNNIKDKNGNYNGYTVQKVEANKGKKGYTVEEIKHAAGYKLIKGSSCTNGTSPDGLIVKDVYVGKGEEVTCTFTNKLDKGQVGLQPQPPSATLSNPTPVITTMVPSQVPEGTSHEVTFTLVGTGFMMPDPSKSEPGTLVYVNSVPVSTVHSAPNALTFALPPKYFLNEGTHNVTAANSPPGGGISTVLLAVMSSTQPTPISLPPTSSSDTCQNTCGDLVCQKFVCLGTDCSCAEDAVSCPEDCSAQSPTPPPPSSIPFTTPTPAPNFSTTP